MGAARSVAATTAAASFRRLGADLAARTVRNHCASDPPLGVLRCCDGRIPKAAVVRWSTVYGQVVTKTQQLRNLAEGFMAALVECGYRGPWRWAHHQWEGAFYRVWNEWGPHTDSAFPHLELGGSADGRSTQARAILWNSNARHPSTNTTRSR